MPGTVEAILLLLLLIVPGALSLWLTRSFVPAVLSGQRQFLVFATMMGVVVHLVCSPITIELWPELLMLSAAFEAAKSGGTLSLPGWGVAWVVMVVFIAPAVLALAISHVHHWNWIQPFLALFGKSKAQLTPLSWDWFFLTQSHGCWIVAEMKDGSLVGGPYGTSSFASLSPHSRDLYLEEAYDVRVVKEADRDDVVHSFGDRIRDSIGVWINGEDAKALYFYRVEGA